jgi:hypothetical protein
MQATSVDILRGSIINLEELVIPNIADPHARSAAMCIRTLLNHVALRLEKGDRNLFDDSREKRQLFADLQKSIDETSLPQAVRDGILAAHRRAAEIDAVPVLTTTAALTTENDALRVLTIELLKTLNAAKAEMPAEIFATIIKPVREQLDREAERDNGVVLIDAPLF